MPINIIKALLSLLFCITFVFAGNSQISERIKNRAENRANRRAEQKIDQAVDRTLDKIEGLFQKKNKEQPSEQSQENRDANDEGNEEMTDEEIQQSIFLAGLGMGKEFEPYENPIRMNISMDITTVNQRGKTDEINMKYTLDTWATAMEFETDGKYMRMLLDNKEGSQTMVTEDDGEIQAIKMRQHSLNFGDFVPEESEFTVTPTGKTRTIDGYFCKEYIVEHEEGTTNSWITNDVDLDMMALVKAMSAQAGGQSKMGSQSFYNLDGFPIEAISVSKNGKETTTIHYYDIKLGDDISLDVFNLDGIEVMSLGF